MALNNGSRYLSNPNSIPIEVGGGSVLLGELATKAYGGAQYFTDYDSARAYDYSDTAEGSAVIITDEWRGGLFRYTAESVADRVSVDPAFGLTIPVGSSSTGSTGGLIRVVTKSDYLSACWWGFKTGTDEDMRVPLQRCINYVEAIDERRTITTPAGTALIKSVSPAAPQEAPDEQVGIIIRMPNRVKWIANETRLEIDINTPSMAGIDALLAIAPETSSDQAYLFLQGMTLSGGAWADKEDRPKYTLKADYMVMSYSVLRDMQVYYAQTDNIRYVGFVVEMTNIRARFAGLLGANFKLEVDALNGDSAARTAYYLERCVADYAGIYGYRFFGGNGHTYCHLDTCAADHIGRDESNQTILENIDKAAAYGIDNVRSFVMTSCGAEWCHRAITGSNTRNFTVDSFYGVNCGSTISGTTVDGYINLTGYFEYVTFNNIENRGGKQFDYWLNMTNPDVFNYNSVTMDRSIPRSRVYMAGQETAVYTQIACINDFYREGMRSPAGDALLHGDSLNTNKPLNWFNQQKFAVTKNYYVRSNADPATFQLLELTNPTAEAYLGVIVEVRVGRTNGSDPVAPAMYSITTSSALNGTLEPVVEKVSGGGASTITAAWVNNILEVTLGNAYTVGIATVYVIGRPSTGTQTFEWIESDD